MGHDVNTLGNHKLRTEKIDLLAADLAERLNALIIYGYINDWQRDDEWGDFGFVELGKVGNENNSTYILIDEHYWDKIDRPLEYSNSICFYLYDDADHDECNWMVFSDSFICNALFSSRWWSFCRTFTGEYVGEDWIKYIEEYRLACKEEIELFGGDMAMHLDDQGSISLSATSFDEMGFEEGLNKLRAINHTVQVSGWISGGRTPLDYMPLGFIDDFADLR